LGITIARFQYRIRLQIVIVVFIIAIRRRTLRAIINNLWVADDEMIHRGLLQEEIFARSGSARSVTLARFNSRCQVSVRVRYM